MSLVQLPMYEFASVQSLKDACQLMADHHKAGKQVWALAGCTDWMVEQHSMPWSEGASGLAIDITRIPELKGISLQDGVVRLGASEPFASLRKSALLKEHCPILVRMAKDVGAVQIQARGTLGGNLVTGSPAADGVTALFALDAHVVMMSSQGQRTVPIRSFYTGYRQTVRKPDELVVRFEFAVPKPGTHQVWDKVGTRRAQSISKMVFAGVAWCGNEGRIERVGFGVGSVAERVLGLEEVCKVVRDKLPIELDLATVEDVIDKEIRPIDDIRSTARYRRHVAKMAVRRFLEALTERPERSMR